MRPTHFEIPADDPERLTHFYSGLLGWQIEQLAGWDYWKCKTGEGPGIDGAITRKTPALAAPVNFVNVSDMSGLLQAAVRLGGKVLAPRAAIRGMGWYAIIADPEGNPLGLWQRDAAAE